MARSEEDLVAPPPMDWARQDLLTPLAAMQLTPPLWARYVSPDGEWCPVSDADVLKLEAWFERMGWTVVRQRIRCDCRLTKLDLSPDEAVCLACSDFCPRCHRRRLVGELTHTVERDDPVSEGYGRRHVWHNACSDCAKGVNDEAASAGGSDLESVDVD
jgi:hypothetical protein